MSAFLVVGGNLNRRRKKTEELYLSFRGNKKPENDPDLQVLEGQNSIGIDEIRNLERILSLKPHTFSPKIVTIIESDKLTHEAQSALLRTLEEPSGDTVFILTTSDLDLILPTVASRCKVVNLPVEKEIIMSASELEKQQELLREILTASPGKRLKIAEKTRISSKKDEAKKFCQIQLELWREKILDNPNQKTIETIRQIQKTLLYLKANVNSRLAVENLLLNFPYHPHLLTNPKLTASP